MQKTRNKKRNPRFYFIFIVMLFIPLILSSIAVYMPASFHKRANTKANCRSNIGTCFLQFVSGATVRREEK